MFWELHVEMSMFSLPFFQILDVPECGGSRGEHCTEHDLR